MPQTELPNVALQASPVSNGGRLQLLLAGQTRILEMIALGDASEQILHAITELIDSMSPGLISSITVLEPDGQTLGKAISASLPREFVEAAGKLKIGPDVGSCGTAAFLKQRVIVQDIDSDSKWVTARDLARRHGLRACWSEPILSRDGQVLGTFAIYYPQPVGPTAEHIGLIETAAHLAGIAIQRQRSDDELRLARDAAEAASSSKDRFLAVVSHELRTPLAPVMAAVDLLENRSDLPEQVRQDLATIRRNVELESYLIDDLLDLTRIARGKLNLRLAVVDVHAVIHEVVRICQSQLLSKNHDLQFDLRARTSLVWADAGRLRQVFWNLLSNAIKFTHKQGKITFKTRLDGSGGIVIELADTGIGIGADVMPRLFTAFEQGEAAEISRQFGGLGLGLAISRALLEMQSGEITARSQGPDRGATFSVRLPLTDRTAPASPDPQAPAQLAHHGNGEAPRILLVEDHADTLSVMLRLLESMGYPVTGADCVEDAVTLAAQQAFDLLISDLGLPDGSGLDVLRRLKECNGGGSVPLKSIALSGFGMEQDVRRSVEAGFDRHLTKPVDADALQRTIRELCS
ncbi:MAG TPA: ATP-binding protein [Tepidisphaeraceae bacterium]|jgi:signal transduction histidine kinase/CheY-like chemotaxis protein